MGSVNKKNIFEFDSRERLAEEAAGFIAGLSAACIHKRGNFTVALSGGNSPLPVYERIGSSEYVDRILWEKIFVFWCDERMVDFHDKESNFYMADKAFLSKVKIPERNIFRVPVELHNPENTALKYEKSIKDFFKENGIINNDFPVFDLVILGVGKDGHTASLFPGADSLRERQKWTVSLRGDAGLAVRDRITMTLPVLNSAGNVVFVVSGKEKGVVVKKILEGAGENYPASMIKPAGRILWFIDKNIYEHEQSV